LVIVNPNTNARVTLWLAEEARRVAGTAIEVIAVNAESGIEAIETPEHLEIAARAVASEVAKHRGASGAVVAGFGDPGVEEAQALGLMPVAGLGKSGMSAAALGGRRFSIVTLGMAMREPILAKAASLDLASQLAEVLVLPFSIAEMVRDRDAALAEILRAVRAVRMAPCYWAEPRSRAWRPASRWRRGGSCSTASRPASKRSSV
jgi:Asp/Glu/hydantoin racemase